MLRKKEFNRVFHYKPVAIVLSLIILIMSVSIVIQERNDVYQVTKQSILNNAKLIGHDSEAVFIDAYKFLGSIGTYYENDVLKKQKSIDSFEQLVRKQIEYYPIINHVSTIDKDGNVISTTSTTQDKSEKIANLQDRKYFKEAKEGKKEIIIYGPVQSIITKEWIVLIAKRLEDSDKNFAGILVAAININTFIQMYKNVDLGPNGIINLRKNDLSQVARYPELTGEDKGPGNKNISSTLSNILKDNSNFQEITYEAISPLDNKNKIYAIYKLDKIDMFISVGRSPDDFGTTWKTTAWFLGIFLIFSLIVIILIARRLDHQSDQLQEIVQEKVNTLEIINRLREDFIKETNPFELYNNLRNNLLKITSSKEVFIGEILYSKTQNLEFKIFSSTELFQNSKITQYSEKTNKYFEFIIKNKEIFISNNPQDDNAEYEFLEDGISLNSFMAIPIIFGEKVVGIVGFANKSQGYKEVDTEELNDILLALGQVIIARQEREQNYLIQKENLIQKERIEHFIKYSSDGIHILDLNGNVIECSDSFANLLGYSVQEVMNLNVKDWDAFFPFDELITIVKEISTQKRIFETKYKKKDGSIIDVQINAVGMYLDNATYLYASARDITEIKEKDKLIFEQTKLASMGEMIGNIAHQWRQPLSVISTIASGEICQQELCGVINENFINEMSLIVKQTQYLSKTIDDFRSFIKFNNIKTIFSINDSLEQTLSLISPAMKNNFINLIINFNDDLKVEGYQNELIQAFINIINNAKDALNENILDNEDKLIFIETKKIDSDYEIYIKDNGKGIPENIIDRIFEPYFTTKHQSVGTGIGLSMTYKIITEHHNAQIQVTNCDYIYNNQNYHGACFKITFKENEY